MAKQKECGRPATGSSKARAAKTIVRDAMNVKGETNALLHEELLAAGPVPGERERLRKIAKANGATEEELKLL